MESATVIQANYPVSCNYPQRDTKETKTKKAEKRENKKIRKKSWKLEPLQFGTATREEK